MNSYTSKIYLFSLVSVLICIVSDAFNLQKTFIIAECLILIAGIYSFRIIFLFPSIRFNFFIVSASMILLGSSLGVINTYYSIELFTDSSWDILLQDSEITINDILKARIYTNLFCVSFIIFGSLLQNTGIIDKIYHKGRLCLLESNVLIYLVVVIFFIQIYLILNGNIIFGGSGLSNNSKSSHPLMGLTPLFAILPVWAGFKLSRRTANRWYHYSNLLTYSSLGSSFYYFFTNGRRMLIFYFILIFIGFFMDREISFNLIRKNIILIFFVLVSVVQVSNIYNKLRLFQGYEFVQQQGLLESMQKLDNAESQSFKNITLSNVSTRSSYSAVTFAYFNTVVKKYQKHLQGKIMVNSFLNATPSDWFIDKSKVNVQERLYMEEYPINIFDVSDSIYLESMLDFGYLGLVIYPLFFYVLLVVFYRFMAGNSVNSFIIGVSLILMALSMIETGTTTLFTTLRALLVCAPIIRLLEIFQTRSLNSQQGDTSTSINSFQ